VHHATGEIRGWSANQTNTSRKSYNAGFEQGSCEYPQVIAKTYLQAVGAAGDKRSVTQFATNF